MSVEVATHGFKNGDIVRVKKTGKLVRLESINPDPNYDPTDETWADASDGYGSNNVELDSPDDVEPVDFEIPTAIQVAESVGSLIHSSGRKLWINQTDHDNTSIYVEGEWDGLPIRFEIAVHGFEVAL